MTHKEFWIRGDRLVWVIRQRSLTKRIMTNRGWLDRIVRDESRRIEANIAKLPELLTKT
jgi:hypothetical protein